MNLRAVDCMGFAGGFTLGMVQSGFELVGKRELPGGFGVRNCEVNRHLLGTSWSSEVGDPTTWSIPHGGADVVFGNPPCSGFSVMSAKTFRGADSKINHCMWAFAEYVARVRPLIAVFESVQQAFKSSDGLDLMRRLRDLVVQRTGLRWTLHHVLHNAYSVGGPAERRRYFWLISRVPFGVEEPVQSGYPVLNDVIGDLEPLGRSWWPQPYVLPTIGYARQFRSATGAVDGHFWMHSPLINRIIDLLRGVGWGPSESMSEVSRRYWLEHGALPASFASTEAKIVASDFRMGYMAPTRWDGGRPSRVVTGGALSMVIHPRLDRTISHREAARIMGFPDDWQLYPLRRVGGIHLTHGKGITVHCGRWIGGWISRALSGSPGSIAGDRFGSSEYVIDVTRSWRRPQPASVV